MAQACQRFRDDLSAFADDRLPQRRWQQVAYHLAGCPDCRLELDDIKRVQQTLTACRAPAAAPAALTERLCQIAGDRGDEPLYLEPTGGATLTLPSPRKQRQRRIVRTSAVSAMVMASVVVMALLMAPPLPTVDDPVATARAEYLVGAAAISVNQPVAAVLLAQAHGMEAPAPQRAAARSAMLSESEPMHTEDALTVLESATNPQVHFHGKQRVYVTDGEGAFHSYTVNVDHIHGAGSRLSVMEDDANEGAAWFIPEGQSPLETPAGWTFCDYAGLDQVAGRWAKVIEATNSDGAVVARWWVDAGRNVVLWTERYDGLGQPIMMFGFESIHYDKVARDVSGVETVVMGGASPGPEAEGRCASTRSCPMTLAGLPLVAYSSSSRDGTLRLVYSDGFRVASVLHTPGVMARAEERVFEPGMPDVLARQVDGTVISVATNGGVSVLTQAAAELPAAKPYEPSWWGQTSAGFQRMVGVR